VAADFLAGLGKTLGMLQHCPFLGVTREQLGTSLRVTFHHPYAIYYQINDPELVIVRVLHGARDSAAIAEQGGFLQ
jgi:toxin ParE1/3/4